jgi:hypothetical protein
VSEDDEQNPPFFGRPDGGPTLFPFDVVCVRTKATGIEEGFFGLLWLDLMVAHVAFIVLIPLEVHISH